jgi:hypothetical protein
VNGAAFIETDRPTIYVGQGNAWVLILSGILVTTISGLPSDLGGNDVGFFAYSSDNGPYVAGEGLLYRWEGAIWHIRAGVIYDLYANRPAAFSGVDAGVEFCATDLGFSRWVLDFGANAWTYIGNAYPAFGTLAAITTGLGAHDTRFQYYATDFDRIYVWGGASWRDGDGQPTRGMICYFTANPGTGWQLCDGSTVTGSTSTGGTGSVTVPNLTGSNRFIRSNTSSGGTGGSLVSGNDNEASQTVQSGVGATVPAEPHTHNVLPVYYDLEPYYRL